MVSWGRREGQELVLISVVLSSGDNRNIGLPGNMRMVDQIAPRCEHSYTESNELD